MGMPTDTDRDDQGGLSRRQVLARGAVAAGVVWAAPVIRTATAYATSAAGTERPCTNFYLVAVDLLGVRPVRFSPTSRFGYDDIPADAAAALAAATTTTTSSTSTTSTSTTTTTTTPPPEPKAGQPRASRHTTTTTSSTTTTSTTKPPRHDPGDDETASKSKPTPSTTKPKRPAAHPTTTTSTTTTTTTKPPLPDRVGPGAPVDDFGLFTDPSTVDLTSPAAAVPADPADPHSVAFAAAAASSQAGTPDDLPPGIKNWLLDNPDVPVRYPAALPMITQTGDDAWAILLRPVGGPDPLTHQCRTVNGWATAQGKHAEFFVDPNPPTDEAGRRIIFPNPRADALASDPSALIESVIFVYCCPQ
jgi:hypothetical protein